MTVSDGDYIIPIKTTDGKVTALTVDTAVSDGDYVLAGRTTDGFIAPYQVGNASDGDYGIAAKTTDGNVVMVTPETGCSCPRPQVGQTVAYIYVGAPLPNPIPPGETHEAMPLDDVQAWMDANNYDFYMVYIQGNHTLNTELQGRNTTTISGISTEDVMPEINMNPPVVGTYYFLNAFTCCQNVHIIFGSIFRNSQIYRVGNSSETTSFCGCKLSVIPTQTNTVGAGFSVLMFMDGKMYESEVILDVDFTGDNGTAGTDDLSDGGVGGNGGGYGFFGMVFQLIWDDLELHDTTVSGTIDMIGGNGGNGGRGGRGGSCGNGGQGQNTNLRLDFSRPVRTTIDIDINIQSGDGGNGGENLAAGGRCHAGDGGSGGSMVIYHDLNYGQFASAAQDANVDISTIARAGDGGFGGDGSDGVFGTGVSFAHNGGFGGNGGAGGNVSAMSVTTVSTNDSIINYENTLHLGRGGKGGDGGTGSAGGGDGGFAGDGGNASTLDDIGLFINNTYRSTITNTLDIYPPNDGGGDGGNGGGIQTANSNDFPDGGGRGGSGIVSTGDHIELKNVDTKECDITWNVELHPASSWSGNGGDVGASPLKPGNRGGGDAGDVSLTVNIETPAAMQSETLSYDITIPTIAAGNGGAGYTTSVSNGGDGGSITLLRNTTVAGGGNAPMRSVVLNGAYSQGTLIAGSGGNAQNPGLDGTVTDTLVESPELGTPMRDWLLLDVTNNGFIQQSLSNSIGSAVYIDADSGDNNNNGTGFGDAIKDFSTYNFYFHMPVNIHVRGDVPMDLTLPDVDNVDTSDFFIDGVTGGICSQSSSNGYNKYYNFVDMNMDANNFTHRSFKSFLRCTEVGIIDDAQSVEDCDCNQVRYVTDVKNVRMRTYLGYVFQCENVDGITMKAGVVATGNRILINDCTNVINCDITGTYHLCADVRDSISRNEYGRGFWRIGYGLNLQAIDNSGNAFDLCDELDECSAEGPSSHGYANSSQLTLCTADSCGGDGFNSSSFIDQCDSTNNTGCGYKICSFITNSTESGNGGTSCDIV